MLCDLYHKIKCQINSNMRQIYSNFLTWCSDINPLFGYDPASSSADACSRYSDAYMRPFHVTPFREITFHADVNIIAPNTPAPSGVVSAYQGEISIFLVTFPLT